MTASYIVVNMKIWIRALCNACQYKIPRDDPGDVDGIRIKKRVPAKVMWYVPLIPRLKCLFMNKTNAKLMRWHKEERNKTIC